MAKFNEAGTQPVIGAGHPCSKCHKLKCECDETVKTTDTCC